MCGGIHFDPTEGKRVGEPFRVFTFGRNGLTIPRWIELVELCLNQDKLVLTMAEVSGGIWYVGVYNALAGRHPFKFPGNAIYQSL